jgi:hypothetical protein
MTSSYKGIWNYTRGNLKTYAFMNHRNQEAGAMVPQNLPKSL